MQSINFENYTQELQKIREWTIKAQEDCNLVSEYKLPIVSPFRDLAIPDACVCDYICQAFLGTTMDEMFNTPYDYKRLQASNGYTAPIKDVIVLKKSDSLQENTHHQTPTAWKEDRKAFDLNKI